MSNQYAVTLMGNFLILCPKDVRPPEVFRLGSIPLDMPNGERVLVRVYGFLELCESREEQMEFERLLRSTCESAEVLKVLFNYTGPAPRAKRWNKSANQIQRRWDYRFKKAEVVQ